LAQELDSLVSRLTDNDAQRLTCRRGVKRVYASEPVLSKLTMPFWNCQRHRFANVTVEIKAGHFSHGLKEKIASWADQAPRGLENIINGGITQYQSGYNQVGLVGCKTLLLDFPFEVYR
jgi:hypothetical protein